MADLDDTKQQDTIDKDAKDLKIEELEASWRRALADYKNLERRFNEEKEILGKFANFILLERLIPVFDNLESLCAHVPDKGLEMITTQLRDLIHDEGVEEIKAVGLDFDPETMEASEVVEGEDGKVIEVVNKGYTINGKTLRPARVKVGKSAV